MTDTPPLAAAEESSQSAGPNVASGRRRGWGWGSGGRVHRKPPPPRFPLPLTAKRGLTRSLGPATVRGTLSGVLLLLLLSACAKPKQPADEGKKERKETPLPSLAIGGGDVTVYGSAQATEPSFTVRWVSGGFDAEKGTVSTGHLERPQGEIFTNGKPASTYRADTGDAVREAKRLDMRGDVVLRSSDGRQTLKSPAAQYRGDVKLLRATGGVVATGPFGTLSGVPELWATPDLRLIGTPDMVSKTLKLPALLALAATATTGTAKVQSGNDYTLTAGSDAKLERLKPVGYRLTLPAKSGSPTTVTIPSRGLAFRFSGTVVVDIMPNGKKNAVRHMTTKGPVSVVQRSEGGGRATIDGTGAEFDAKPGSEMADLEIGGRVTVVNDPIGSDGTISKGDRGTAVLLANPGKENALRSVTLIGNVTIDSRAGDDTFAGTGERLVYVPGAESASVDLSGGVVLTRVTKGPGGSNTVVSRGQTAHAVLDSAPIKDTNPMRSATLTGGVTIDVSGSNGETFKGTGDKVVYTGQGASGTAVMSGNLKFGGNAADVLGGMTGADTATVTIGKEGWETVETSNSTGGPSSTTIKTKQPPAVPKPKPKKGGKP